jgi:SAM-dependent methyltransferase
MTVFKDHFSSHAAGYAAHRPSYPHSLIDFLAAAAPERRLALDCGCGTGQLSVLLAAQFDRVVATDASAQQIANAAPHDAVEYRTSPAERSGLPARSVDLVTVAQAAHWLDLRAFYDEVRRVARPRAIVALVTYGVLHVARDEANAVVQRFYREVIGSYWPPERAHVEDGYRSLPFPFEEIEAPAMAIEVSWRLRDLVGYTETWSAVRAAEKAVGRKPMEDFQAALAEAWGDPELPRNVLWPLSLRAGRL